MKQHKKIKIFRWTARIWSILVLIFAIVLLLTQLSADSGEAPTTLFWVLFGLWFFGVLGLVAGWRWEIAGAVIAITALISREMAVFYLSGEFLVGFWLVWLPIIPPAVLYILAWREESKQKEAQIIQEIRENNQSGL